MESKLSSVPRPSKSRAVFVTRLDPAMTPDNITELLASVIYKKPAVCTKLQSKFDGYDSFHIFVDWNDFDKINGANV